MFSVSTANAAQKMFDFMEQIAPRFEAHGFEVEGVFHKRWADGDYGMYIRHKGRPVLYLGLWSELWRDRGYSLCIGVHQGKWAAADVARFQRRFPDCEPYPPNDAHPFLVKGVNPMLLAGDAVHDVSTWLLRGYLAGLRER
ncbi:hypothetical protein [Azohydromonas caseinilytica]|uniref:Uncharacterized protein n=1 Tax=Azohydromonas caseinilytica TaxID=2728836 RepID=A0A848FAI3_9BURK|nr:hypothetical protein [Azohydromonas caseinilytica]NML15876.1 hypothetical protein [Azohydromonas caseinilytica]